MRLGNLSPVKRVGVLASIGVGAVALALIPLLLFVRSVFGPMDYSRLPPKQVFQKVWRRPLPAGVTELLVAGHGAGQGHNVWMRIGGPPELLKSLVDKSERMDAEEFRRWLPDELDDAKKVHWDSGLIGRAVLYKFDATVHESSGWYGVMALDRSQGLLYVEACIL